jgi:hypothetical protein
VRSSNVVRGAQLNALRDGGLGVEEGCESEDGSLELTIPSLGCHPVRQLEGEREKAEAANKTRQEAMEKIRLDQEEAKRASGE